MNVIMPMAGDGIRLSDHYDMPKPLIKINNHHLFLWGLRGLPSFYNYIFIVKEEHILSYDIDKAIYKHYPNATIFIQNKKLDGAVMSLMLAKDLIDNNESLLIVDCDIFAQIDYNSFYYIDGDGAVVVSKQNSPNYSYVLEEKNKVLAIKEKEIISDSAISGMYFWKRGSDFVKYAQSTIDKNLSVNNEFYVAPVFNEAILDGKSISTIYAQSFYHLGTKEDIELFEKDYDAQD